MSIITIILFFIYTWGLGFTATYFLKKSENFLERTIMNIGIGLGVFPILSILLNFLHIPLDWRIFLLLSLIGPIIFIAKGKITIQKIKLTKANITIFIVILIFIATLFMYTKGSFGYPYLEDNDPWGHSVGSKYVALEKTAYDPILDNDKIIDYALSYIDPYPPAYDVLMGILHQTNDSIKWTLKFFNSLIISLGILFFYFFAKLFVKNRNHALFATFVIAAIPSYLSHFIWAHSLVVTLFFPLMYCVLKISEDKKWMYPSAIVLASIWVTQNLSQPIKLTTMLILFIIVKSIASKKLQKDAIIATLSGIALSTIWWISVILRHGMTAFLAYYNVGGSIKTTAENVATKSSASLLSKIPTIWSSFFDAGGTASRAYVFQDFFIAKPNNLINNPIGIGIFLSILTLIAIIYVLYKYKSNIVNEKNAWITITLFWLIYTFLGVNGETFHISIARGAFRMWMLMAIPIALISYKGIEILSEQAKKIKIPHMIILIIIILGIFFTSASQKYSVNTAIWPTAGAFVGGPQDAFQYASWFDTIPKNTKVFFLAGQDRIVIGLDGYSCDWCQENLDFRKDILYKNSTEIHSFLKRNKYKYLVVGRMDAKRLAKDENSTARFNELVQDLGSNPKLIPEHQVDGVMIALRVV